MEEELNELIMALFFVSVDFVSTVPPGSVVSCHDPDNPTRIHSGVWVGDGIVYVPYKEHTHSVDDLRIYEGSIQEFAGSCSSV